jgi:hypothetical protein
MFESPVDFTKRKDVSFEYYACIAHKGIRYVIANIPADPAFDDRAIQLIGDQLGTLENAEERVNKLYDKAIDIRKERIGKEMPGLAKILESRKEEERKGQ